MLVLAVVGLFAARAQEAPAAPPAAVPEAAPPPAPVSAEPLGDRFVWEQRARLPSGYGADSIAVAPDGDWLVVDDDGAVWRSDDKGGSWSRVLGGMGAVEEGPDAEKILLEAETIREEETDSLEVDTTTEEVDGVEVQTTDTSEVESAVEQAREEVTARLQDHVTGQAARNVVWIHPDGTLALVGRADGVWRSEDGGRTWSQVSNDAALAFYARGDSLVAGTPHGVEYSVDRGVTWIEIEGAAGGRPVSQLAEEGPWLYAGGEGGLWRSRDGLHWDAVEGLGTQAVVAIVPDPFWQGGLWVATRSGLLRTDDDGKTFFPSGRQPLSDLRRLVHLGTAGHLLAISGDGVWESIDGGVRWTPAGRLLTEPDVRDVAFDGGLPVAATATGVWRMVAPTVTAGAARKTTFLPLFDTVGIAASREGLDTEPLSLAHKSTLALLAPQLTVTFDYDDKGNRGVDYAAIANDEDYDNDWSLQAKLCWGNCSATTVEYVGTDEVEVDAAALDEGLYVVDGEVFSEDQVVGAAANVAESIRSYHRQLSQVIADAWIARQRLAGEEGEVADLPLREQVEHALKEMELDARLDFYTEGAWRDALKTSQEKR